MTICVGNRISIQHGDFGVSIPFRVLAYGVDTLEPDDKLTFSVENGDGVTLLSRVYPDSTILLDGCFDFALTEAESKLLAVGLYRWKLVLECAAASQSTIKGPAFFEVRR